MMNKKNEEKSIWNLKFLYKGDNDPQIEKDFELVEKRSYQFINKWKDRGDYLKEPNILQEALEDYEDWIKNGGNSGNFGYYFWLRSSQEQNNSEIKARENKINDFVQKISNDARFFGMNISKIPEKNQKKFLEFEGLQKYKHYLETSFAEAKYLLSEKEENILSLENKSAFSNWVEMVESLISKEEKEVLGENNRKEKKNFPELISLISHRDKKIRDSSAKALNEILEKYSDVAEYEINSILNSKKVEDNLRKIKRPDEERHISDDIETDIVDTLIDEVSGRFDISKRFYELKSKLMRVDKLEYHERNVPYGKIDKEYSYRESLDLVLKVFKELDKKFFEILDKFIKNGQIDSHPNKGKRDGAFCSYNYISQPTYILLNHTNRLNDVLTIAHEVGHGINNELIKEKQNAINFGTPMSTAEVASTFMEDFVLQELLKEADDELKLSILMDKLGSDVSTIFRQVACYKFEQELHRDFRDKGYLSKKEIGLLFQKNMSAYMGNFVEQSDGSENWWIYWSHIRNFFYVYSYASGLLISKAMQEKVKEDKKFVEKVKEFMSAGLVDSPKNIFKKMDIDIGNRSFWKKGLEEIDHSLKEAENLAIKLGKI